MKTISHIREFIKKERLYILLLIFVILVSFGLLLSGGKDEAAGTAKIKTEESTLKEQYSLTREKLEILVKEKREVVVAMNLLALLVILFIVSGLALDLYLILNRPRRTIFPEQPVFNINWGIWDVCRAVILFMFFGYALMLAESALADIFASIKEREHIRMMANALVLDGLAIFFVLYIVLYECKNKLVSLGLSLANFFRHISVGIAGYIAATPAIIGALIFVVWLTKVFNYEPPLEPILRVFLEEKNVFFIFFSTVFVTLVGPVFEEIFFRGFMYGALRKKIGVSASIFLTAFLFSMLHTNLIGFLPIMVLGILLAYLYEMTGSLIPSIIVHIIHNTGMMTFVFLMKEIKI